MILLIGLVFSFGGCSNGSQDIPVNVDTSTIEQNQATAPPELTPIPTPGFAWRQHQREERPPTSELDPTSEPEIPVFEVGETAIIANWEVTLDAFEFTNRVDSRGTFFYYPHDGNTFLYATFTVANLGNTGRIFLPRHARGDDILVVSTYDDGFHFGATRLSTYQHGLEGAVTNPLTSTAGTITFSIANRAVESDGPLTISFVTNSATEAVIFNVR